MSRNILLCGVGGQGTVLASKLIASAAMSKGMKVMSAETIGMAQRGGSVFSHIRIGNDIDTPMIGLGTADMIIGFEPAEAVRVLPYLKKGGFVVVADRPVMPVTAALAGTPYSGADMIQYIKKIVGDRMTVINVDNACETIGSSKVLNIVLLGAAIRSGMIGLEIEDIAEAIKKKTKPQFLGMNMKALELTNNIKKE